MSNPDKIMIGASQYAQLQEMLWKAAKTDPVLKFNLLWKDQARNMFNYSHRPRD